MRLSRKRFNIRHEWENEEEIAGVVLAVCVAMATGPAERIVWVAVVVRRGRLEDQV